MRKLLYRLKLSQQIMLIVCLCVLVPTLLLWYFIMSSAQQTAIQTRKQEAELRRGQLEIQVERIVEVCNLSTQVFLNTPNLVSYLADLKQGRTPDTLKLLDFYWEDIASLEKIVVSNPELYQIRVYSDVENINEMMPILYGAWRVKQPAWEQSRIQTQNWYLDFSERFFSDDPVTEHVMSLVTDIETAGAGHIGILEVSIRMNEILPELYEKVEKADGEDGDSFAVLLADEGRGVIGDCPVELSVLQQIPYTEEVEERVLDGKRVLVAQTQLKEMGCRYIQVTSLVDLNCDMVREAGFLMMVLLVGFSLLMVVISRLTQRLLRGFYRAFDGMRAFADGDVDAVVEISGGGEVAAFAREAGGLLDKIRQLMQDNLKRERESQILEIRALQNQINAHFIYNVLEAIKMMAEIDEEYEIADAMTSLGKLLRYSMKWEGGSVTLQQELDYIENYIMLMNLRFDHVIHLRKEVPRELLMQRIPKISLQPIVENAVVHGVAALDSDSEILLQGTVDADRKRIMVMVTDDGQGMDGERLERLRRQIAGLEPAHSSSGNGIGLHNVHSRIQRFFGMEYGLTVCSQPEKGTTVTLTLPYQIQEEER